MVPLDKRKQGVEELEFIRKRLSNVKRQVVKYNVTTSANILFNNNCYVLSFEEIGTFTQ